MNFSVEIPERAYFSISNIAEILSINHKTIRGWIETGKIRSIKLPKGTIRIEREAIVDFVNRDGRGFVVNTHKMVSNRILMNLRSRMRGLIVGKTNKEWAERYIGCSVECLKNHLESQFKKGMSWQNYGRNGWVIDHIIPCSKFDFSRNDHIKMCFHYSNLQPLWALENIKKSDGLTHRSVSNFIANLGTIS